MTAVFAYHRLQFACLALLMILFGAMAPARGADTIAVVIDQATISKLPERVTTIVIGNPMIADVTVQTGGLIVVTGKAYGTTNMIALDRAGAVLAERTLEVSGPRDKVVIVYRGAERESYSCTPNCERRITLGDASGYFSEAMGLAAAYSSRAKAP